MPSNEPIQPRERAPLLDAYDELCRADYHLGCAASALEKTARQGWCAEADRLMTQCIKLREAIAKELDGWSRRPWGR